MEVFEGIALLKGGIKGRQAVQVVLDFPIKAQAVMVLEEKGEFTPQLGRIQNEFECRFAIKTWLGFGCFGFQIEFIFEAIHIYVFINDETGAYLLGFAIDFNGVTPASYSRLFLKHLDIEWQVVLLRKLVDEVGGWGSGDAAANDSYSFFGFF